MSRIRVIDPQELKNEIRRYITANRVSMTTLSDRLGFDQSSIYRILRTGRAYRITLDKLAEKGIFLTKQKPL